MGKAKILRITTVPISLHKLIKGQPKYFISKGFDVYLASSAGKEISLVENETGLKVNQLPLTRKFNPFYDLYSLWATLKLIRNIRPHIVHTHTPKAGLIGMLAARLSGVPVRMHTIAGLPLSTKKGIYKRLLIFIERLTVWASTMSYPNSNNLKNILLKYKIGNNQKLKVIGYGSSNGIDLEYFKLTEKLKQQSEQLKLEYNIQTTGVVFCFVGRIVSDKGINELVWSFQKLQESTSIPINLLLVGPFEDELDPLDKATKEIIGINPDIISTGYQDDVRPYLALADIFVFPSYREGFPNVVLQAGAMDLPSIVTDINGSNEIIVDGVNGIIVPPKNKEALFDAMKELLKNKEYRLRLSAPARQRNKERYEQHFVWNELLKEYIRLLDQKRIGHNISIN